MDADYEDLARFLVILLDQADAIVAQTRAAPESHYATKPDGTLVTAADLAVEKALIASINTSYPEDEILAEETLYRATDRRLHRWIIDPIDGTFSYSRGSPFHATLVALESAGEIVLGGVSAPIAGDRIVAALNMGVQDNWTAPANVIREARKPLISLPSLEKVDSRRRTQFVSDVARLAGKTRSYGDYLPFVLAARNIVDFVCEFDLEYWDYAPFRRIMLEANLTLTGLDGEWPIVTDGVMAGDPRLVATAAELWRQSAS